MVTLASPRRSAGTYTHTCFHDLPPDTPMTKHLNQNHRVTGSVRSPGRDSPGRARMRIRASGSRQLNAHAAPSRVRCWRLPHAITCMQPRALSGHRSLLWTLPQPTGPLQPIGPFQPTGPCQPTGLFQDTGLLLPGSAYRSSLAHLSVHWPTKGPTKGPSASHAALAARPLSGAAFSGAAFSGAAFSGAAFSGAAFSGAAFSASPLGLAS